MTRIEHESDTNEKKTTETASVPLILIFQHYTLDKHPVGD